MDKKILTTLWEILCLESDKIWSPFLLGGKALLKPLTTILLILALFATPILAAPGDDAYNQARDLKSKGDLLGAVTAAKTSLASMPDNIKTVILLGDIYLDMAQYDSSLAYYRSALAKKGKDPDALYGAGLSAYYLKMYDDALQYFSLGEKGGKNKQKFNYGIGLAQMEKGDYPSADINFRKAIDKDKKNPLYHMALAEVNYRTKTFPIALSEFSKAIELDSSLNKKQSIHFQMAQAYLNMRNIPGAIQEYKNDLQVSPNDTTAWMDLARIYEISNNIPEAIYCYDKFLAISANNGQAWFDLGKLYLKKPDQEKAAESFEKAVKQGSNVAESYGYLAKIYSDRKEYEAALDAYNRYEAQFGSPDSSLYWFEKGKVMMKVGEKNSAYFDSALTAFDKAVMIDPKFATAYEYAGLTMYYQKDYKRAIEYFNKQLVIDSTSVNTYRNLAFSYLKTEQYNSAANAFAKALEIKPDDVIMRSMLGKIYSFNKDYSKSVEQFEYILDKGGDNLTDSLRCEIYPELGSSYLQLGNCQASIPVLLKAEKCSPREISILMNIAGSYERCDKIKDANSYYKKVLAIDPKNKDAVKGDLRTTIQGKE
jgi:tetratricopeptide (TPR) repeat protein